MFLVSAFALYTSSGIAHASSYRTLEVWPIRASFEPPIFSTYYTVFIRDSAPVRDEEVTITWTLKLELVDKAGTPSPEAGPGSGAAVDVGCTNNGVGVTEPVTQTLRLVKGRTELKEFVWHHPDAADSVPPGRYHCNHLEMGPRGHQGLVTVVVSNKSWKCTATYKGTNSSLPSRIGEPDMNIKNGTASEPTCTKLS